MTTYKSSSSSRRGRAASYLVPPAALADLREELARVPPAERLAARAVRRTVDILASVIALLLTAPLIAAAGLAIRLDTPGPAFFRQERLGRGGQPFRLLKLRGMYRDARERFPELYRYEYTEQEARELRFHIANDPRVTPAARFFRRTSIDELPNFWNVLLGDMSLVGPRPQIPEMFPYYGPFKDVVLSVKPGIFSLPKVLSRDNIGLEETLLLDAYYVHSRSLTLDARIVWHGIRAVLARKGVV